MAHTRNTGQDKCDSEVSLGYKAKSHLKKQWKNGGNQMISLVCYSIPKIIKGPSLFKGVIPGWDYGTVDKIAHCISMITWVSIHGTQKKLGAVTDIWTSSIGGLEIYECLHHTGQPVYWSWWAPGLMKYLGSKIRWRAFEKGPWCQSLSSICKHTHTWTSICTCIYMHNDNNNNNFFEGLYKFALCVGKEKIFIIFL